MRTIIKGREPGSLSRHRFTPYANYENYKDKDTLRASLVSEQRGLCCYCLSRIRIQPMKIEHWHSQDRYPAEQLDYGNLLGACLGNEGQPGKHQHCDTRKGNSELSRNPANPRCRVSDLIRFEADGRIISDDKAFNDELTDVLNLNEAFLKNNRRATLEAFEGALLKRGNLTRIALEKGLRWWNGESHAGDLEPFCEVIVYWLQKRLARG
jgi:uncharacterized protein (TIGR02646 family)